MMRACDALGICHEVALPGRAPHYVFPEHGTRRLMVPKRLVANLSLRLNEAFSSELDIHFDE
jgi:hypothetical protein